MSSRVGSITEADLNKRRGMILPFEPLSITFDDIRYAVDMPQVLDLWKLTDLYKSELNSQTYGLISGNESSRCGRGPA